MGDNMNRIKATFDIAITDEDIDDIMSTALYDGIGYWCKSAQAVNGTLGNYLSEQIGKGGAIIIETIDGIDRMLTKANLLNGLQQAIENGYINYGTALLFGVSKVMIDTGEIDSEAADIIIQFALFGEVVYG